MSAKIQKTEQSSINPLFDNILLKPLEAEQKTQSGLFVPDTAKEKPQIGLVMAIGPGSINDQGKLVPVAVKKGQKVLYKKWGGTEVKVKGEEWVLVEQKDILAILE